jgi:hypothetical protein
MMKKRSKRKFVKGCLWGDLSIELFVDNILDNLQAREVELYHCMLDRFMEDYFDAFISDLVGTIVHEYVHYFEPDLSEQQVKRISRWISEIMTSKVSNRSISPNCISPNQDSKTQCKNSNTLDEETIQFT